MRSAPPDSDAAWIQVLRVGNHPALRARDHLRGGTQRLRQVQRGGRARLGDGGAGRQVAARRRDGERDLRGNLHPGPPSAAPRSPLLDNADGALPIAYSEVTISRTLFRNGGSEYAINGSPCPPPRHSGAALGHRDGPRDARDRRPGLNSTPSSCHRRRSPRLHRGGRRVLKHRRRKESVAQAGGDGGQLPARDRPVHRDPPPTRPARPPGGRGAAGRGHPVDVRDARARLLADDLVQAQARLASEVRDEEELPDTARRRRG